MRTSNGAGWVSTVALGAALTLVACGGDVQEDPGQAAGDATTQTDDGGDDGTEGTEDPTDDPEQETTTEEDEGLDWDPEDPVRVTYRYEADFHESDAPATMILAREDGRQSLQWEQGGMRAHVYPDADDPFVCTARGEDWECYTGDDSPEGYQLERTFLGEDEELLAAFEEDATEEEIAGRDAVCVDGLSLDGFDGQMCADVETGIVLRTVGATADGQMSAEATDFGEPRPEDFEAPAEVEDLGM